MKEERDGQQYRCIVTSSNGTSVISDVAVITVNVNITKQPEDVILPIGQTATFTVEATGKDLTYQWQYNRGAGWKDSTLGTAKTATVSLPVKEERNGQQYRCIVTSSNGTSVISDVAALTVLFPLGDVDLNGIVNLDDADLLSRYVNEDSTAVISSLGLFNADVNQDGIVNFVDVSMIMEMTTLAN